MIPSKVKPIPIGNDQAMGRLSKNNPIRGWNTDADIWYTNVIRPIWAKLKDKSSLNKGYTAEITDCSISFKQCEILNAIRIGKAILRIGGLWFCIILYCLLQKTVQRYVKNTYPIHIKTKLPDSRQYRIGEFCLYQFSNPGLASMASFGMANV